MRSGLRFYAGAPLLTQEGVALGALCVAGLEPCEVSEAKRTALADLASMIMSQIELQHSLSRIDPFTGLPNRSQFTEDLQAKAKEEPSTLYCAFLTELVDSIEISTLHRVMGPNYLDDVERDAGFSLQRVLDPTSRLYAIGQCQFVHLVKATDEEGLLNEALRLRKQLIDLNSARIVTVLIHPVIGISPFRLGEAEPSDVLRTALSACQDARRAESGASIYSMSLDAGYQRRFALLNDIRPALQAGDQLRLVYQPRVEVKSGNCLGAEALLRWCHPVLGEISPAEFIPLIEHTPLARPLTDWMVHSAIEQSALWHYQGHTLRISINVSATCLGDEAFAQRLLALMEHHGLPKAALELELTESALLGKGCVARAQLQALIAAGIKIAIDDFGTGYSTLSYLQEVHAHVVKIDQSFIIGLCSEPRSQTLVKAMIGIAHELGYLVVAEGVENDETYQRLAQLECDEVQGYLIAKPLTPDEFQSWLAVGYPQARVE